MCFTETVFILKNEKNISKLTLERSTPVNACTAGGTCPTRRVNSPLVASLPPRSTISSVLANGAATSAAICKRKKYHGSQINVYYNMHRI